MSLIRYISKHEGDIYTITLAKPVNFDIRFNADEKTINVIFNECDDFVISKKISRDMTPKEIELNIGNLVIGLCKLFEGYYFTKEDVIAEIDEYFGEKG